MPQINRIRVNNVKYNFGTQFYDDFMMRFNCKNTIYDLANGGGKSLLMLLLLQNVIPNCTLDEKQPIEKLFRAGCDNTVIHSLIEWKLDPCYQKDNFKYMTTGFCARKGSGSDDDDSSYAGENIQASAENTVVSTNSDSASIDYFNYCIFYRQFGDNDIKNLPLTSNGERITYNGLKAYLRELERKDFNVSVKIFDRKGDYQNFITQYGLFESEWEIIRGINKTEGHVRTYFETNYRTSRKVVEDLLIEEIIQKSFNNRLAVSDDEGMMAQTLMDIKDKLVELSKKNAQISSYSKQISALEDFSLYVKSFEEMYTQKEHLQRQLFNMLLSCKRQLADKENIQNEIEENLEKKKLEQITEQKNIQTAEVMSEQESLKAIEKLIETNETVRNSHNEEYQQYQQKLKLMESANDYMDYRQYEKLLHEVKETVNNRMRNHQDIAEELSVLAAAYKKLTDKDSEQLEVKKVETDKLIDTIKQQLEREKEIQRNKEREAAALEGCAEHTGRVIEEEEERLALLMKKAGLIVAENAALELEKCRESILKSNNEKTNAVNAYMAAAEELDKNREALAKAESMKVLLEERLDKEKLQEKRKSEDVQRMDNLKNVYLQQDEKLLIDMILETYKELNEEYNNLIRRQKELNIFADEAAKGEYSLNDNGRNKLKEYLVLHYGNCVSEGREWLAAMTAAERSEILDRIPYAEYALVINEDFEKIRQDKTLENFEFGAYTVPIISSEVAKAGGFEINREHLVFALKDLSFLHDSAKCDIEIKAAKEELDNVELKIDKQLDKMSVVWEDYTFMLKKEALSENRESSAEDTAGKLLDVEAEIELLKEKEIQLKNSNSVKKDETVRIENVILELTKRAEALEESADLSTGLSKKYQEAKEYSRLSSESADEAVKAGQKAEELSVKLDEMYEKAGSIASEIKAAQDKWQVFERYYRSDVNVNKDITSDMTEGVNLADADSIESRFMGLKAVIDKDTSDVSDKETLMNHYKTSMDKCRKSIEYRGNVFDEIKQMVEEEKQVAADAAKLMKVRDQLDIIGKEIADIDRELDSQNALMNRLEGSIAHGINQIEQKYGEYTTFACDNTQIYINQHKEYLNKLSADIKVAEGELKNIASDVRKLSVIEKDMERIVANAQMEVPEYADNIPSDEAAADISTYESVQKDFDKLCRLEFRKQDEFNKYKIKLMDELNALNAPELAQEIKVSVNVPENVKQTKELTRRLAETNIFIELEKERISKGIEDMEKIKDNFENRCIQTCSNIKTELDRLPKLSTITMDKEVISIIGLQIPYIKEELYKEKMSSYIDETIMIAESFESAQERLKYIRNRLTWKRLFSVIVTDMNAVRINLYKRERIKDQSRYLRYEEAVGSTGQSQGIYIQFLIAIINYISSINVSETEDAILGKVIFIDNPFGAAKDIYIWEPIFKLLKTNHVQLVVPARGATPAITGRFEVNYILGQKLVNRKQQTVVVDYYSRTNETELEYTRMDYSQVKFSFLD